MTELAKLRALPIQRRMMELGRIRLGEKGAKGEPKKLTNFRLTSASRALLESAAPIYGGTVREWKGAPDEGMFELYTETNTLDIVLPPVFSAQDGTPTLPYSQAFELWSGGGCQRRCDGQVESFSGKDCMCDPEDRKCDLVTRLNVMLLKVAGLGVWRLETKGWNAAAILPGTLDVLLRAANQAQFIEAVLRLEQRTKKVPGEPTRKFVVPVIDLPNVTLEGLLASSQQAALLNAPVAAPRPALPSAPAPVSREFEHDQVVEHGPKPALPGRSPVTPPADSQFDNPFAELEATLFELTDQLGAGEATREAVAEKRATMSAAQYKALLKRWANVARKNLDERAGGVQASAESGDSGEASPAEPTQSQFAEMAERAQKRKGPPDG